MENAAGSGGFDLDNTTTENTEGAEETRFYYLISVPSVLSVVFKNSFLT